MTLSLFSCNNKPKYVGIWQKGDYEEITDTSAIDGTTFTSIVAPDILELNEDGTYTYKFEYEGKSDMAKGVYKINENKIKIIEDHISEEEVQYVAFEIKGNDTLLISDIISSNKQVFIRKK